MGATGTLRVAVVNHTSRVWHLGLGGLLQRGGEVLARFEILAASGEKVAQLEHKGDSFNLAKGMSCTLLITSKRTPTRVNPTTGAQVPVPSHIGTFGVIDSLKPGKWRERDFDLVDRKDQVTLQDSDPPYRSPLGGKPGQPDAVVVATYPVPEGKDEPRIDIRGAYEGSWREAEEKRVEFDLDTRRGGDHWRFVVDSLGTGAHRYGFLTCRLELQRQGVARFSARRGGAACALEASESKIVLYLRGELPPTGNRVATFGLIDAKGSKRNFEVVTAQEHGRKGLALSNARTPFSPSEEIKTTLFDPREDPVIQLSDTGIQVLGAGY